LKADENPSGYPNFEAKVGTLFAKIHRCEDEPLSSCGIIFNLEFQVSYFYFHLIIVFQKDFAK